MKLCCLIRYVPGGCMNNLWNHILVSFWDVATGLKVMDGRGGIELVSFVFACNLKSALSRSTRDQTLMLLCLVRRPLFECPSYTYIGVEGRIRTFGEEYRKLAEYWDWGLLARTGELQKGELSLLSFGSRGVWVSILAAQLTVWEQGMEKGRKWWQREAWFSQMWAFSVLTAATTNWSPTQGQRY